MTKVYEVLKRAERKRNGQGEFEEVIEPVRASQKAPNLDLTETMLGLHRSIESCLPDLNHKVIQFVSSREGEGTSTIVREFARVVVARKGKSVLILDADGANSNQFNYFEAAAKYSLVEVCKNGESVDTAICKVGDSNLWTGQVSAASADAESQAVYPYFNQVWDDLRQRFDLVLIDAPPVTTCADGIGLACKPDGIILVVEAEKTRWPVINNVKDRLTENGGNLIGVVLNRRQFYIPQCVYSRLR